MTSRLPLLLPVFALLGACGPALDLDEAPLADPHQIGQLWSAVQPDGLLELVEDPASIVPIGLTCPSIDIIDGVEVWTGDCALLDGTVIEGRLLKQEDAEGVWVAGEGFAVVQDDQVELVLDGTIELTDQGELAWLDVTAATCGAHQSCDAGPVTLDLRYTLRLDPLSPLVADAAVRGFVAIGGQDPAAVEGAWRVDAPTCELEPIDGLFAVQLDDRQALTHDGADRCDGCAAWSVQGVDAPAWCPTDS